MTTHFDKKRTTSPDPYLTEAIAIGDRLLAGLAHSGASADNHTNGSRPNPSYGAPDILSGLPGILLFLIGLYKQNPDKDYLAAIRSAMDRITRNAFPLRQNYSLYTGLMGIAYTSIRLYEVSRDAADLDRALQIARHSAKEFTNDENTSDALFDGRAGCLLTLLHLHAACGEKGLLLPINQLIRKIIANMQSAGTGVYWGSNDGNVRAECGFASGAAGIAYVFLELGHYFRNKSFYYLSEKAMAYENGQWNSRFGNWPDYRKEIRSTKQYRHHRERFEAGDSDFFSTPDDNISYPAGTIGIGLVRARAAQLLNTQQYHDDLSKACRKLSATYALVTSDSLTDGRSGYGLFFLEAYKVTGNPAHLAFALRIAQDLQPAPATTDASLATGLAGIGLFYLQLAEHSTSVFLPNIATTCKNISETVPYPWISLGKGEMKLAFLKKMYPRTICVLEQLAPAEWRRYLLYMTEKDDQEKFSRLVQNLTQHLEKPSADQLNVLFNLETIKTRMAANFTSGAYHHIKQIIRSEDTDMILHFTERAFLEQELILDEDVIVCKTTVPTVINDERHFEGALPQLDDPDTIVLKPSPDRHIIKRTPDFQHIELYHGGQRNIMELHLYGMTGAAFTAFRQPLKVREAIDAIVGKFEEKETAGVTKMIIRYIRHYLKLGLLKPVPQ